MSRFGKVGLFTSRFGKSTNDLAYKFKGYYLIKILAIINAIYHAKLTKY
jgi:hypothetical protein